MLATLILGGLLIMGALAIDQAGLWAARRGWINWRGSRSQSSGGGVAGAFGEMQALFSPAYRHAIEEIRSKQMSRSDTTNGANGPIRVDLNAGVITIGRRTWPSPRHWIRRDT